MHFPGNSVYSKWPSGAEEKHNTVNKHPKQKRGKAYHNLTIRNPDGQIYCVCTLTT